MIDRTRLSVRAVLASALFLGVAAARSGPVAADDFLIRSHSPCHAALVEEKRASDRLKSQNASQDDARRTLAAVDAGLAWNNHACGPIAGPSPEDNAVRNQMYLVNNAFLHSLRGQAQTVLHDAGAAATYTRANAELDQCVTTALKLPAAVRANCKLQKTDNATSAHFVAMTPNNPCQVALQAANDAGNALKSKDHASIETAYARASAGLDANKGCGRPYEQMRDLNRAYLLTWRTVADRYLDVPFSADPLIPANAADPFAVPDALFTQCNTAAAGYPKDVMGDCASQLASNRRFPADYAAQPAATGQTMQALSPQPVDWPYALRPDFVWDAPCVNNEHARCAEEKVRDGSGENGWGSVSSGQATPLDGDKERVLFATIRNCDDLHRLFSGQPPQFTCDAFKSNLLLVIAQHKPDQQCGMTVDNVSSVATPAGGANPTRDAVLLNYTLTCAAPVAGSGGNTMIKAVTIPRSNEHGEFANVTFNQSGGGGPR